MLAALMPGFAFAAPSSSSDGPQVFAALVARMNLFSKYASAVYCDNNNNGARGALVTCGADSCPEVEAAGAFIFGNFLNVGLFSATGMVAIDPTNEHIVVSFRGAQYLGALSQIIADLIPCPAVCEECHCHHGFYQTWTDVRDETISLVAEAQREYPDYSLVLTGHSLGAAQALLAAAEFRTNNTQAELFNYGQPHVGDETFAEYVTSQGDNYRVTHTDDPAPRIGEPSLGYRHTSPEYWIYEDVDANYAVSPDQIKVVTGTNSVEGNQVRHVRLSESTAD